jgi:hypothetical protein
VALLIDVTDADKTAGRGAGVKHATANQGKECGAPRGTTDADSGNIGLTEFDFFELQRGRAPKSAETRTVPSMKSSSPPLQRGRAPKSAENSDPDAARRARAIEKRIAVLRDEQHALNLGGKPKNYTAVEKQKRYRLAVDLAGNFSAISA